MSKHSKNNTSSTIFTYGQRKMLKGVYGTLEQRIGQDSQKSFSMCTLCTQTVIEPMACDKGHVFCRACIIQCLMKQKKEKQLKKKAYDEEIIRKDKLEKEKQDILNAKKLDLFEKYENYTDINIRNEFKKGSEVEVQVPTFTIKPTGKYELNSDKKNYTKTSFWTIQQTPVYQSELKKDESHTVCPGSGHKLSIKKLRELKPKVIDTIICCNLCTKEISKQKVGCYKCGHIVCISCKGKKCEICDKADDWLELQAGGSAFCASGTAYVKKYSHAFIS